MTRKIFEKLDILKGENPKINLLGKENVSSWAGIMLSLVLITFIGSLSGYKLLAIKTKTMTNFSKFENEGNFVTADEAPDLGNHNFMLAIGIFVRDSFTGQGTHVDHPELFNLYATITETDTDFKKTYKHARMHPCTHADWTKMYQPAV
jgi:hypothetical protein